MMRLRHRWERNCGLCLILPTFFKIYADLHELVGLIQYLFFLKRWSSKYRPPGISEKYPLEISYLIFAN
jgi:hypothetical protein